MGIGKWNGKISKIVIEKPVIGPAAPILVPQLPLHNVIFAYCLAKMISYGVTTKKLDVLVRNKLKLISI